MPCVVDHQVIDGEVTGVCQRFIQNKNSFIANTQQFRKVVAFSPGLPVDVCRIDGISVFVGVPAVVSDVVVTAICQDLYAVVVRGIVHNDLPGAEVIVCINAEQTGEDTATSQCCKYSTFVFPENKISSASDGTV